ncbi:MAG: hypothetical protein NC209_07455 [Alistipes sp.]|nr:hypothetical protein [Alistipes senegalensis]MCM1250960.1 hypothetical protein [Alistipes sp.]
MGKWNRFFLSNPISPYPLPGGFISQPAGKRILFGFHSSDCCDLSASGFRTFPTGALTNVGAQGLCWSSSASAAGSTTASDLNFNSTNVNPSNGDNRANGFTVRCVQHLRAAFLR